LCTPLPGGKERVDEHEVNLPDEVHQMILKGLKKFNFGPHDESGPMFVLRSIDTTGEYPVIEVVPRLDS
jgi:hypothetical protein